MREGKLGAVAALAAVLWAAGAGTSTARAQAPAARPNILLLVADDLGYADLGVHGSDIRTPNKWHLGDTLEHSPAAAGFDRSFAMAFGAGEHFGGVGIRPGGSVFWEDRREAQWPDGAYSTELYTDKLIEYIDAGKDSGQPFFAYAAYTSPHWPLQVPEAELDRYAGRYDDGYDHLRERNFERLQRAGIVPPSARLPPRNAAIKPWAELSAAEQRVEARKMELYAAMVENLDGHVGRLMEYLRANGLYDDTLIVFMGDNGAAAEDFYEQGPFVDYIRAHYRNTYETMGQPASFVSYGPQWAQAGAAPFRLFKGYPTEGGFIAPFLVAGPGIPARGALSRAYVDVTDLLPTFLELAGARYPADKAQPVGRSAWPLFSGRTDRVHGPEHVNVFMHLQRVSVRQGDWKLMSLALPFDERGFELYNVAEDPGETTDLSATHPDKRAELIGVWRQKRREYGIVLPEDL